MAGQQSQNDEDTYSPRAVLLGLAITLLLVFGGLYLFYLLRDSTQREDCMMQGRTNCAPVEATTPGKP
jgi:hypothetical protein